ncbi:MAG TPA: hypothetical protein VED43_07940, partial [Mycobacterium sp.]|nr:hypothetical protein [Mycobacterium sp.]
MSYAGARTTEAIGAIADGSAHPAGGRWARPRFFLSNVHTPQLSDHLLQLPAQIVAALRRRLDRSHHLIC